jgi:hypothetical protein
MDDYSGECPKCGYRRERLPEWVKHGVVFAFQGALYRVVSVGSTNKPHEAHPWAHRSHFRDYVIAERVGEEWEGLPACPATKADVGAALANLYKLPKFEIADMRRAIRRVA